jgi:hypothetical protein
MSLGKSMRRTLLIGLLALTVTLVSVTAASAQFERGFTDSDLELIEGNGRVNVTLRGALIGSVQGAGTLTITDYPGGVETEVLVLNETTSWELDPDTTVYVGENLRFRVFRGKWRVRMQGSGIFTSLVGVGSIGFVGEGRYSLGGAPYRPWPTEWTTLKLGEE